MGLESRRQTILGAWTSFVLQVYKLELWLYFIPGSEKDYLPLLHLESTDLKVDDNLYLRIKKKKNKFHAT
jgi:hypothetical protein